MKNRNGKTMTASAFVVLLGVMTAAAAQTGGGAMTAAATSPKDSSQGQVGDSVLNPDIGLGVPLSELNLSRIGAGSQRPGDPGLAVGARYMYQTSERVSLGGQISHTNFGDRDFVEPGLAGTIGGSLLTIEGLARYWLMPPKTVNPYVVAGLGINRFAAHVHETFDPSEVLLDSDSIGLAASAGAGVEGRFGKDNSLAAGAELVYELATIDSGKFGSSALSGLGLAGRVGYRF